MAKKYMLNHTQLVEIFKRWDDSFFSQPEAFKKLSNTVECAEGQADDFAKFLNEVQKESIITKK